MMANVRRECVSGINEGTLRAFLDGELDIDRLRMLQEHTRSCAACAERLSQLKMDGALVHSRLALLDAEVAPAGVAPPVASLLDRARKRESWIERLGRGMAGAWPVSEARRPGMALVGAAAAVVVIGAALAQPAVQSFAAGMLQTLRVQRVQPITLDPATLAALSVPSLDELLKTGTYQGPKQPTIHSGTVTEASKLTGLSLRAPGKIPAGLPASPTVLMSDPINFTFTYDGQKVAQVAQEYGVKDAGVLSQLKATNGLVVKGSVPAAAVLVYGDPMPQDGQPGAGKEKGGQPNGAAIAKATLPARLPGPAGAEHAVNVAGKAAPFLAMLQMNSPSLNLPDTVDVDKLRTDVLKSGAVPPALANQLLGISDWKTTLLIPVASGSSRQVPVDGTTGTLITGQPSGGVALVWEKNGVLNVVGGSVGEQAVLEAVRTLAPAK